MEINNLKKEIIEQREQNISLFKIFQYRLHEREMQRTIEEWRVGSNRIKKMIRELQILELENKETEVKEEYTPTFINGYGEATNREITNSSYQRNQKRLTKDILNFIS